VTSRPTDTPRAARAGTARPRPSQTPEGESPADVRPPAPSFGTPAPAKPDPRRALGAEGEARAARFLARRGYRIVDRNVRAGGVEVDLIARRGGVVVFVEVKTRRSLRHGPPELAVDGAKQRRLIRAATAWLTENPARFRSARFDVIACTAPERPGDAWQIDHLPGAFYAGN
jgi:putative endonuclease